MPEESHARVSEGLACFWNDKKVRPVGKACRYVGHKNLYPKIISTANERNEQLRTKLSERHTEDKHDYKRCTTIVPNFKIGFPVDK